MAQRMTFDRRVKPVQRKRPVIGVLCCNRSLLGHAAQVVASRFVEPLTRYADVSVLLVPALPDAIDADAFADLLDGLLLTGACSNIQPKRYGSKRHAIAASLDPDRDEVALRLAAQMVETGRPVFGICRGLQELNVLFGGTLRDDVGVQGHHSEPGMSDTLTRFDHRHDVDIADGGLLAFAMGGGRHCVNSVHQQGIARLGAGLAIEAVCSQDGLVEAVSASPAGGRVLGVQWHPEWDADENPGSRAFFELLGAEAYG